MDYTTLADTLFPHIHDTPESLETRFPPRDLPEGAAVTRFAPSPTGFLHLGNLYGALVDERLAHRSGGIFYLRVEDTDQKREVPGAVGKILEMLNEFDIPTDEGAGQLSIVHCPLSIDYGPYYQRQRADIYHVCAKWLTARGLAYPCFCSEEELNAVRERQTANKANPGYYGPWAVHRELPAGEAARLVSEGKPYVLRLRSPGDPDRRVKFTDLGRGVLEFPENDQDVVLLKSDGIPTYHFAHVVDDHCMRTTHVVRGDEWLATLPIHLQLFAVMEWKPPKYLHTAPLMKQDGPSKRKLSKRKLSKRKDPELSLDFYRERGYCAQTLKEYLMTLLNSNFEEWRAANPGAAMTNFPFSVKKMSASGALFDLDKLNDVSKGVVARMTAKEAYDLLAVWAGQYDPEFAVLLKRDPAYAEAILSIGRGGPKPRKDLAVWSEAKAYMSFFYDELYTHSNEYPPNMAAETLRKALTRFAYDPAEDNAAWFERVKTVAAEIGFAANMKDYKQDPDAWPGHVGDVSMALRVAVTGRQQSPDLCEVMRLLGAERVRARLSAACASLV